MSLASLWFRSSSSEFKFCLSRYWWLKLKSLAEKEEWEELEKFSKSKKSPIGYLVGKSRPQLAPMILFDFFNVKNILLCIIFRPLWTSASRKITSTRPRSTFPEWRPSRRSKLTWPSGKTSAPPPNPSKWPQGSSIISALFFFSQRPRRGCRRSDRTQERSGNIGGARKMLRLGSLVDWQVKSSQVVHCQKVSRKSPCVCVCAGYLGTPPWPDIIGQGQGSRSRVKVGWGKTRLLHPPPQYVAIARQVLDLLTWLALTFIHMMWQANWIMTHSQSMHNHGCQTRGSLADLDAVFFFPLGPRKQMALARISQLYRDCDLSRLSVFFFSFLNIIWIIIHTYLLAIMRHDFWYQIYF